MAVMAMTALGVLSTTVHLRTFSVNRVLMSRELVGAAGKMNENSLFITAC